MTQREYSDNIPKKDSPNYSGDTYWTEVLMKRLTAYYEKIGHTNVKFWYDTLTGPTGIKTYEIKSNIKFSPAPFN